MSESKKGSIENSSPRLIESAQRTLLPILRLLNSLPPPPASAVETSRAPPSLSSQRTSSSLTSHRPPWYNTSYYASSSRAWRQSRNPHPADHGRLCGARSEDVDARSEPCGWRSGVGRRGEDLLEAVAAILYVGSEHVWDDGRPGLGGVPGSIGGKRQAVTVDLKILSSIQGERVREVV